ncbi:hypothetical protein NEOLEDRAFT_1175282 [Neolentinus lepideus HHB14362 ss-1]|uniref:Uncharacterized protein n=1 Tax=Neolentinus lepideus HHB14362 ss-1 TaxID=1314782 RepID=A0A165UZP8_9AGAM|nr:hypothetical protein NEOLEDRAFT_1175282 [Neolentinus lepideus HHB14362 ss-1]
MSKRTQSHKPGHKVVKPNGKVTDFFHIIPSSSPSSQPSSSQSKVMLKQPPRASQGGLKVKKDNIPPPQDQEVISISSGSHISISSNSVVCTSPGRATRSRTRAVMGKVEIVSPRKNRSGTVISVSSSSEAPAKQSRSTKSNVLATKSSSLKPLSQGSIKRKKKFESDSESDSEPVESVVQVSRTSALSTSKSDIVSAPTCPPQVKFDGPLVPMENLTWTLEQRSSDRPSPKKKAKLEASTAPAVQTATEEEERVPSSQSDEQELISPRVEAKDPRETKENIEQWRRETSLVASQPDDHDLGWLDMQPTGMDIDPATESTQKDIHEASTTVRSETEVSFLLQACTPSTPISTLPPTPAKPDIFRPFTPPPMNELPRLPATPVVKVTGLSRAKEIIARIQAQASALSDSGEEEKKVPVDVDLPDLSDSSSEDEELKFFPKALGRRPLTTPKSSRKATLGLSSPLTPLTPPLTSLSSDALTPIASSSRSTSHVLRSRSPSEGRRATRASTRLSNPVPVVRLTSRDQPQPKPKKKKGSNPLDSMLKEKTLADKRGRGMSAMRDAEAAGKDRMKREMECEDDEDEEGDEENDDVDMEAMVKRGRRIGQTSSPRPDEESDDDILDDRDRLRLLGEKRGQAVGAILEKDKAQKKNKERESDVPGVDVFETGVLKDVRNEQAQLPRLVLEGGEKHAVLRMMQGAAERNDFDSAKMLVGTCVCVGLNASQLSRLLPWLSELACSPGFGSLSETCFQTLVNMAPRLSQETTISVVPMMHASMVRWGGKSSFMQIVGCDAAAITHKVAISARADALYRMVHIMSLLASSSAVPVQEIPSLILTLVLIGLDFSSAPELQRRVIIAIDSAGRLWEAHASAPSEQVLCDKLVALANGLTPINKAHLFSLLACGAPIIGRVARFVAHTILISSHNAAVATFARQKEEKGEHDSLPSVRPLPVPSTFTPLPSLKTLIILLSPSVGSGALFDMSNPNIDYDELGHFVEIMSVALTDVDAYVAEERNSSARCEDWVASPSSSPRKEGAEKPPTLLETVKDLIYSVHGKIVDTRAAHLDRSRTKAALQRLSMRVHFQRLAALKAGPARYGVGGGPAKARTLRELWKLGASVS